jgi:UDP-N-acetylmuramoyl-L-alanyl-D-glutamate--2,6-diaminopimelate ligase
VAAQRTAAQLASAVGGTLVAGDPTTTVVGITHDSRRVEPGWAFCCIPGDLHDGHDHAAAAVAGGAVVLLVERRLDVDVTQVLVTDARRALGPAAAEVFAHPADSLRTIGVTGTNGKTSVVSLLGHLVAACGRTADVVGTLTGERTTPEASDLQARLARDVADGVDVVALEVSSHALVLGRVDGLVVDVAVFTNLGQDHLDFHGTTEEYFLAKARLFTPAHARQAVVWVDDAAGARLAGTSSIPTRSVGMEDAVDLRGAGGRWIWRWRGHEVELPWPGRHNVANALLALEAAVALDLDERSLAAALADAPVVPGRFEVVAAPSREHPDRPLVVVDFAHTPDALDRVIVAARDLCGPDGSLRLVVGCGGDRDRSKRPVVGRVGASGADWVAVCDDNPRSEDPATIRSEVLAGVPAELVGRVREIGDRRGAIRAALTSARQGDVVLIAGKGHEQGQTAGGVTVPFDDRIVALEELAAVGSPTDGGAP